MRVVAGAPDGACILRIKRVEECISSSMREWCCRRCRWRGAARRVGDPQQLEERSCGGWLPEDARAAMENKTSAPSFYLWPVHRSSAGFRWAGRCLVGSQVIALRLPTHAGPAVQGASMFFIMDMSVDHHRRGEGQRQRSAPFLASIHAAFSSRSATRAAMKSSISCSTQAFFEPILICLGNFPAAIAAKFALR